MDLIKVKNIFQHYQTYWTNIQFVMERLIYITLGNLVYLMKWDILSIPGHILIIPLYELRSVKYLQTLPTTQQILLYDYDGQLGACMTAYLRVLGYDVKVLLFGAKPIILQRID